MLGILIETDNTYKELFKHLKCFILCAGCLDPYPNNKELLEHKDRINKVLFENNNNSEEDTCDNKDFVISIPILNVFGEADEIIKPERSKNSEKLYKSVESFNHLGKHFIPSKKPDIDRYVSFLEKFLSSD